ncbi:MAG: low molecular weight protein-tyrosine-phosphatase [Lentilitoribacter sp.]
MSGNIKSVLFVCMGNICRSPMVEGVFKAKIANSHLVHHLQIDSAGTGSWHEGNLPDPRAIKTMQRHNIDITDQRSRPIRRSDYFEFDLILTMDHDNLDVLIANAPIEEQQKIHLFMDFALAQDTPIPDPYYGEGDGFETVYHMLDKGCSGLFEKLVAK